MRRQLQNIVKWSKYRNLFHHNYLYTHVLFMNTPNMRCYTSKTMAKIFSIQDFKPKLAKKIAKLAEEKFEKEEEEEIEQIEEEEKIPTLAQDFDDNFEKTPFELKQEEYKLTNEILAKIKKLFENHQFEKVDEFLEDLKKEYRKKGAPKITWKAIYTSIISGYANTKKLGKMNRVFQQMLEDQVRPSVHSFNAMMDGYGKAGQLEDLEKCFSHMKEYVNPNIVTYNILINSYGKAGQLDKMMEYYKFLCKSDEMRPNSFTFNAMMDAFGKNGDIAKVLTLSREMRKRNIHVSVVTNNILLRAFCEAGELRNAFDLFHQYKHTKKLNTSSYNVLLTWLTKNDRLDQALDIFEDLKESDKKPNEISYHIMLTALAKNGNMLKFDQYYEEMKEAGYQLDVPSFANMIEANVKNGNPHIAYEIFEKMLRDEIPPTIDIVNNLIYGYAKNGKAKAIEIFNRMNEWDLVPSQYSMSALVAILRSEGGVEHLDRVLECLDRIRRRGIIPTIYTTNAIIASLGEAKRLNEMWQMFEQIKRDGLEPEVSTYNSLLQAFGSNKKINKFEEIVDMMEKNGIQPNKITYSTLINNFAKNGRTKRAIKYLDEMKERQIQPDIIVYTALIHWLCEKKEIKTALQIFERMKEDEIKPKMSVYSTLLHALADHQLNKEAWKIFDEFQKEMNNTFSWHALKALVKICSKKEDTQRMAEYFTHAKSIKKKDQNIVHALLQTCEQFDDLVSAVKIYDHFKAKVIPSLHTFKVMMNMLERAEEWEGVLHVFNEMKEWKVKPDHRCYNYEQRAKRALNKLSETNQ